MTTVTQNGQLTTGEWHHLALTIGDGHLDLMVDGADGGRADAQAQDIGGVLTIGGSATKTNYYTGEIDELEVSNVARSTDWLKAAARSQGMVSPLVVYGGDTQKEGGGRVVLHHDPCATSPSTVGWSSASSASCS